MPVAEVVLVAVPVVQVEVPLEETVQMLPPPMAMAGSILAEAAAVGMHRLRKVHLALLEVQE
jgi:hypothetical protein